MFLCWCSSKESPANEAHWFGPWSRKIPHTLERLSLGTSITDPVLQRLGATYFVVAVLELLFAKPVPETCASVSNPVFIKKEGSLYKCQNLL